MSRPIPALDPNGIHNERIGFIRTGSLPVPPASRSRRAEEAGYTMWAGPKAVFINAVLPGFDLEALQVRVAGKFLVLSGPLRSGKNGRGQAAGRAGTFSHTVELPYRIDVDRVEIRKENGLISIVLKRMDSESGNGRNRLETSIRNSMGRYFGGNGASSNNREEAALILQTLDKYFEFIHVPNATQ